MPGRTIAVRRPWPAACWTASSCAGLQVTFGAGFENRALDRRLRGLAEHPDAGRIDEERASQPGGSRARRGHERVDGHTVRLGSAGAAVESRMDDAVVRFGRLPVGVGAGEIAQDRVSAAGSHQRGPLGISDESGHLVAAAHQRVEDRPPDISARAGQEDSHAPPRRYDVDRRRTNAQTPVIVSQGAGRLLEPATPPLPDAWRCGTLIDGLSRRAESGSRP